MTPVEPSSKQKSVWTRSFVTVLTAQMAFGYAGSTFLLLPKFLSTQLQASAAQIGHVIALAAFASVLAIPFVGTAIDRFGRKPLIMLGCGCSSVYAFGWLLVGELGWFVDALQVLGGIAFMLTFNAASTLVADQAPPERLGHAIGIFGAANMAMSAIAPAAAELLAVNVGWRAAFGLAGGVALLSLLLARRIGEPQRLPERAAGAGLQASALDALRSLLRRLLPESIAMITCGAAYGAVSTFYQPFVLAQGASEVSGFFVGFTAAAVCTRVFFGSLPDRIGRRRAALGSYVAYALMVLAMTQLTPSRLLVFGFLFGTAHGVFYPALTALCVELTSASERGRVMSLIMGSFRLGNMLSALLLGLLAEQYGYRAVFLVSALASGLGVGAVYAGGNEKREARPEVTLG